MAKTEHNIFLSRRGLLQSVGAISAVSILSGCGSDSDSEVVYVGGSGGDGSGNLFIPEGEVSYGTSIGNNCGGKCVTRMHMQGSVIKRITTDETLETDSVTGPQKRACLKCRGKRSEIYKPDRLRYPLRQDGERGDLNGFIRITWEEAFTEIAQKMKDTAAEPYTGTDKYYQTNSADYGKGTICAPFGGGMTHFYGGYKFGTKVANAIGAAMPHNSSAMSYPQTNYVEQFTLATGDTITCANGRADILNCQQLVLWGFNPADSIMDTSTMYLLIQARDKGIPITVIDTHVSRTSRMLGAKHLAPLAGTDPALVCGMLYHLMDLQLAQADIYDGVYLDFNFIKKATHGFFDLPNPRTLNSTPSGAGTPLDSDFYPGTSYTTAMSAYYLTDPKAYRVPAGTSFSAYIFGDSNRLVSAGLNAAPSVYPHTIGYNVNSENDAPDGAADPLYDKRVPIYGQVPKTPKWASYITGIPEQAIKDLAVAMAQTAKVGMLTGWGSNRTIEGEQAPWAVNTLAIVLGIWGQQGNFWGSTHMPQSPYSLGAPSLGGTISERTNATSMVRNRRYNANKRTVMPTTTTGRTARIWSQATGTGRCAPGRTTS